MDGRDRTLAGLHRHAAEMARCVEAVAGTWPAGARHTLGRDFAAAAAAVPTGVAAAAAGRGAARRAALRAARGALSESFFCLRRARRRDLVDGATVARLQLQMACLEGRLIEACQRAGEPPSYGAGERRISRTLLRRCTDLCRDA